MREGPRFYPSLNVLSAWLSHSQPSSWLSMLSGMPAKKTGYNKKRHCLSQDLRDTQSTIELAWLSVHFVRGDSFLSPPMYPLRLQYPQMFLCLTV